MMLLEAKIQVFLKPYSISPPDNILRAISRHVARANAEVINFSEKPDCYFLAAKNSHYTIIFKIQKPSEENGQKWRWKVSKIIKNGGE